MKRKGLLIALVFLIMFTFYHSVDHSIFAGVEVAEGEIHVLKIPTGSTFETVRDSLFRRNLIKDRGQFIHLAYERQYFKNVIPGRYVLTPELDAGNLLRRLQEGLQDSVEIDLSDVNNMYDLAGELGRKLEQDSMAFLGLFRSGTALKTFNTNPHALKAYLLPCKYKVLWNTVPSEFLLRMINQFEMFWTEERRVKARELGLTPLEVIILASIVDGETWKYDEMPKIAGLYINRLNRDMRLQADPTVIYACHQKYPDWKIDRVEREQLFIQSPFNTYLHDGLPPGPISKPDLLCIEAVLNAQKHDFIYMVANPDNFGYHTFSTSLEEHRIHRRKYIAWLESRREPGLADSLNILSDSLRPVPSLKETDSLIVLNQ